MHIEWKTEVNASWQARLKQKIEKAVWKARYEAAKILIDEISKGLPEIYEKVIDSFYAESPSEAHSGSLYGLIEITKEGDGLKWEFIPDRATPFERGGGSQGLYNHVFKGGWHGGAAGTDRHGVSVSTPHYRTPYGRWTHWGRPAERSAPPLDSWNEAVNKYLYTDMAERYAELTQSILPKYL